MNRRDRLFVLAALVALAVPRAASAAPITLTGFVENDFPIPPAGTVNPSVTVLPHSSNPFHLGQAAFMNAQGWVTGWSVKDIRLSYDKGSDTLYVGVNTFSIAGDVDGNGNPGTADPRTTAAGGIDPAHFGGDKSITLAFASPNPASSTTPGTPLIVAGVPADKASAGPGTDGFTVAAYNPTGNGIEYSYGKTLTNNLGNLAFDPSAAHPGFEFTIKNFSQIPGLDPSKGFWVSAYAGSIQGIVAGKDALPWTPVPGFLAQQLATPEPATLLGWTVVLGGAGGWTAWRRRRNRP